MIKEKLFLLLHGNKKVIKAIYALIILNIITLILESYEPLNLKYHYLFKTIELVSIVLFTLEYLLRIYVANIRGRSRWSYIFSFYGLIDLLAIAPFFLPFILALDLRVIRILRIFRFIRIFKLGRFGQSFKAIKSVIKDTKEELAMTMFMALVLLLISSTLMYYAENEAQPEQFKSIGHSLWWAIATLTTVGYGDIYPITAIGKIISSVIAIIGIGFIALPTGIISSAFIEQIRARRIVKCHKCGHVMKD